jgi:PqqD family protein of HPr-rel-A system
MNPIYKLAEHVTYRSTNSELKMLFDRQHGVMYELNETASRIIELLNESPCSIDVLVQRLAEEYEVDLEDLRTDIERFLNDFVSAHLLTVIPSEVVE